MSPAIQMSWWEQVEAAIGWAAGKVEVEMEAEEKKEMEDGSR
ncbi:MAG: hypothetical protein ABIJ50_10325 [Pseudomonadota bacterium]